MRKGMRLVLGILMVLSLSACGGEKKTAEERTPDTGNTTEGVAETIADSLPADIYEIVPEQPYTDADLNYHDDNSRTTVEMNDPSARPAISGSVEDMEQYTIVFIGYA